MIILRKDCLCTSCKREECEYRDKIKQFQRELLTFGPRTMATMFQVMRCPLFLPNQSYEDYITRDEER